MSREVATKFGFAAMPTVYRPARGEVNPSWPAGAHVSVGHLKIIVSVGNDRLSLATPASVTCVPLSQDSDSMKESGPPGIMVVVRRIPREDRQLMTIMDQENQSCCTSASTSTASN